jgi:hypothetical protein
MARTVLYMKMKYSHGYVVHGLVVHDTETIEIWYIFKSLYSMEYG